MLSWHSVNNLCIKLWGWHNDVIKRSGQLMTCIIACVLVTFKDKFLKLKKPFKVQRHAAVAIWRRFFKGFLFNFITIKKKKESFSSQRCLLWLVVFRFLNGLMLNNYAQRSLACVAFGKMSLNMRWIGGFTQVVISLREAGRKITKIHYNVLWKFSYLTEQKQPPEELFFFINIWTYKSRLMVFVMRR